MKLRDNVSVFTAALVLVALEAALASTYWLVREAPASPFASAAFVVESQIFVAGACLLVYWLSRTVLRPYETITRLSQLDELKKEFVANVSHELRSPLAAMEQYAELLLADKKIVEDSRDNLLRVQNNLARLRSMVENLLELSKLDAGKASPRAETFDWDAAVGDVVALLSPRIKKSGLKQTTTLEAKAAAWADPDKARQIVTNLIDNAVKYNKKGGEISVATSADGKTVSVTVRDTGAGIAPEHLGRLFERFSRLPREDGAKVKGAGLGLSISRELARAMGGELSAESRPGQGSAFTCVLPRAETRS
jgi:two-component system, OmpR family, phosphate regulon sensor histidine kinase PhoR